MSGSIPNAAPGRDRLERALLKLSRRRASAGRGRRIAAASPAAEAPRRGVPVREVAPPPPPAVTPPLPEELFDLIDRLDRLADRLSETQAAARPLPASREIFSEWVRLRRWEEIPFEEFLKLRRAGRV